MKKVLDNEREAVTVVLVATNQNAIIYNADSYMEEGEMSAEEYIEYVESLDAQDFRKYFGKSSIEEAKKYLGL